MLIIGVFFFGIFLDEVLDTPMLFGDCGEWRCEVIQ